MTQDVLMARQPIYDLNLNVVAYELLYRDSKNPDKAIFSDGNKATSQVLVNNYTSIYGSGELIKLPAFINLTKELLQSDHVPRLLKHHVVIELLEDIPVDQDLISGVQRFVDRGFRIALDDFSYSPEYEPLLRLAHIVKLDVLHMSRQQLLKHVEILKPFNVALLAEKIETQEQFEFCKDLGFKLFQGYFLCKPVVLKGKRLNTTEIVLIELMSILSNPDVKPAEFEQVLKKDPQLTFKVLRIVNSSANSLVRKIENMAEAIVLIGLVEITRWVMLISFSGNTGKPSELIHHILIKARMCELMAASFYGLPRSSAFMMGAIANLDALLDIPIAEILNRISLSEEIERAILCNEGHYGELLLTVDSFIQAKWHNLPETVSEQPRLLNQTYLDSIKWVSETMEKL